MKLPKHISDELREKFQYWDLSSEESLSELADFIAQTLETEVQAERAYYEEKYVFNRDQAFHRFVSMLTTVLISKTTPDLISAIVEDLTAEYKKTYYPESLSPKKEA